MRTRRITLNYALAFIVSAFFIASLFAGAAQCADQGRVTSSANVILTANDSKEPAVAGAGITTGKPVDDFICSPADPIKRYSNGKISSCTIVSDEARRTFTLSNQAIIKCKAGQSVSFDPEGVFQSCTLDGEQNEMFSIRPPKGSAAFCRKGYTIHFQGDYLRACTIYGNVGFPRYSAESTAFGCKDGKEATFKNGFLSTCVLADDPAGKKVLKKADGSKVNCKTGATVSLDIFGFVSHCEELPQADHPNK